MCLSPLLAFTLMTRGNWPSQMTVTRYCEGDCTQAAVHLSLSLYIGPPPPPRHLAKMKVVTDSVIKYLPVCAGTIR